MPRGDDDRSTRRLLLVAALGGAAAVLVVALAARYAPALLLTLALAAPAADARLSRWLGEAVMDEITFPAGERTIRADLYRPPGASTDAASPPGLVLVHGLSPAGRRQPDLARLARLLARHGQLVLVPELEGLAAFRLSGREVDEIRRAIDELRRRTPSVAVAGFSFGAGPTLLAASDMDRLRYVGSFGGYADLGHVIAFLATGRHTFGDRRYAQPVETYNRWKLSALIAPFVEDAGDRRRLETIIARKLSNPSDDTGALEAELGDRGRMLLALASEGGADAAVDHEAAAGRLIARLPAGARVALETLSPLPAIPRLRTRLLIAHGVGDPSIPFTESLRLAERAGGRARLTILRTFHHTGPSGSKPPLHERALDAWRLLALVDDVLRP